MSANEVARSTLEQAPPPGDSTSSTEPFWLRTATSFALIRLTVPDQLGFDLTSSTSFGSIRSDLPVTTTGLVAADSLRGIVGGGGCTVVLTNANGDIEIRKAKAKR